MKDALAKVVNSQQSAAADTAGAADADAAADSDPTATTNNVDTTAAETASATDPSERPEGADAAQESDDNVKSKDPTQKHQKKSKRDEKRATRTQTADVRTDREAQEMQANQAAQDAIAQEMTKLNEELERVQQKAQQQMDEVQAELEKSQQRAEMQMEEARDQLARAQDAFAENGNKNDQDRQRMKAQAAMQKAQQELEMYRGLATDAKRQHFQQSMDSVTQTAQREKDEWLRRKLALASRLDEARVALKDVRKRPDIADVGAVERRVSAVAQGPAQLDLVSLATSYSDAVGEVMIAEAQNNKTLAETEEEHVRAVSKANLAKAQNKAALLREMAEIAANAARKDMVITNELRAKGNAAESDVMEIETRLKILEAILNPKDAGGDKPKRF